MGNWSLVRLSSNIQSVQSHFEYLWWWALYHILICQCFPWNTVRWMHRKIYDHHYDFWSGNILWLTDGMKQVSYTLSLWKYLHIKCILLQQTNQQHCLLCAVLGFAILEQGEVFASPAEIQKVTTGLAKMWKNQPELCWGKENCTSMETTACLQGATWLDLLSHLGSLA